MAEARPPSPPPTSSGGWTPPGPARRSASAGVLCNVWTRPDQMASSSRALSCWESSWRAPSAGWGSPPAQPRPDPPWLSTTRPGGLRPYRGPHLAVEATSSASLTSQRLSPLQSPKPCAIFCSPSFRRPTASFQRFPMCEIETAPETPALPPSSSPEAGRGGAQGAQPQPF